MGKRRGGEGREGCTLKFLPLSSHMAYWIKPDNVCVAAVERRVTLTKADAETNFGFHLIDRDPVTISIVEPGTMMKLNFLFIPLRRCILLR